MPDFFDRIPKYIQIKEVLRKEIDAGTLREGEQLSSEASLIERFNASKMTVIRALQELVQEGYLQRLQGRGTYVTRPERRIPLIGVMIPSLDKGVFPVILNGVEERAHSLGFEIIFCSTDDDSAKAATFAMRLAQLKVVGVIASSLANEPDRDEDTVWYAPFVKNEIPVVFLDRGVDGIDNLSTVHTRDDSAMTELTNIVIQYGHRRILLIDRSDIQRSTVSARIRGFRNVVNKVKNNVEMAEIVSLNANESFQENLNRLRDSIERLRPTVLMALNDQIALDVIRMLKYLPSFLGKNLSITGFDDLFFADVMGLTTVHRPLGEEGAKAVELLQAILQGDRPLSVTLPSRVVVRSSLANLCAIVNSVEDAVIW